MAVRRELGFDYGRFDYVLHEGEVVLLDVNHTPVGVPERQRRIGQMLAAGIASFLS